MKHIKLYEDFIKEASMTSGFKTGDKFKSLDDGIKELTNVMDLIKRAHAAGNIVSLTKLFKELGEKANACLFVLN